MGREIKDLANGTSVRNARNHCDSWHTSVCVCVRITKPELGCKFDERCSFLHREADGQPQKKNGGKGSVAPQKNSKQPDCASQDTEPLKSNSILRRSTTFLGPKHSLQFSKGALRHMKIRERTGPSQGVIQHADSHVRGRKTPKFKDRLQEEIL